MASSWVPLHETGSSKDDKDPKIEAIVRRYYRRTDLTPMLEDIVKSGEYEFLLESLQRQVSLIKCRSQDLEDGQVTIYDRALLILSKNGENILNLGAVELYLTEFFGIVPIGPVHSKEVIARHVQLQRKIAKASDKIEEGLAISKEILQSDSDKRASAINNYDTRDDYRHRKREEKHQSRREKPTHEDDNSQTERLMGVYNRAKKEYYDALHRDGMVSIDVARFLRDSAENALRYMLTNNSDDRRTIEELEQVFEVARDKATELLGGRKRHFDQGHGRRRRSRKNGRRQVDSYRPREH